jgi:hypothetical protein
MEGLMAKHDQRILKFLTQNADRAPTITDMMTRLNISISDITASLNSLTAQGLVSKRTNGQGIECWFPTSGMALQGAAPQVPAAPPIPESKPAESRVPSMPDSPAPKDPASPSLQGLTVSTAFPALGSVNAPSPSPSASVSSIFAAPAPASEPAGPSGASSAQGHPPATGTASTAPQAPESGPAIVQPIGSSAYGSLGLAQPARSGVGVATFLIGLVVASGASVWVSGMLLRRDVDQLSKGLVKQSSMDEAINSWSDFENKTEGRVQALQKQVQDLETRLAEVKGSNDSLQALVAKQAEEMKNSRVASKRSSRRRR